MVTHHDTEMLTLLQLGCEVQHGLHLDFPAEPVSKQWRILQLLKELLETLL